MDSKYKKNHTQTYDIIIIPIQYFPLAARKTDGALKTKGRQGEGSGDLSMDSREGKRVGKSNEEKVPGGAVGGGVDCGCCGYT